MFNKIFSVLLLFLGEGLIIYAEIHSAKMFYTQNRPFWFVLSRVGLIALISTFMLLSGYMFGLQAFKNIWIVTVISVTSILLTEPILTYSITHELPTKGAIAGLILGFIGLILTLIWN
jgi:drug/metabolite transporter (DMT)-like permease